MMDEHYMRAFEYLMELEGFKSHHPDDPGGETVYGISRVWYPEEYRNGPPDRERAKVFYYDRYWLKLGLDGVQHYRIAREIFEAAVNCGRGTVGRWTQITYNALRPDGWPELIVDGWIGPKTIEALNDLASRHENALYRGLNTRQGMHYFEIGNRSFMRGWFGKRLE